MKTPTEMAQAVAGDVGFIIDSALDGHDRALIALPGGKTPYAALKALSEQKRNWKDVTIIPTDDRIVDVTSELSNVADAGETFPAQRRAGYSFNGGNRRQITR